MEAVPSDQNSTEANRASKNKQILQIEPQNELRFTGPFSGAPVTSYMKLTNPTEHQVYFKIKTTAPKKYCVRPNSGILKALEATDIAVSLQPFDFDPAEKYKHKFMVQTFVAPDDYNEEFGTNLWRDAKPDQFMDTKLKCVLENPVNSTAVNKTTTNATSEKNKGVGDSAKSSVKATDELELAAKEVKQLRARESNLRQENLQLREEVIKLRHAASDTATIASGNMSALAGLTSHRGAQVTPPKISTSVLIAIAMVIVGYLLGKLI